METVKKNNQFEAFKNNFLEIKIQLRKEIND